MPSIHSAQFVSIEGPDAIAFAHAQFSSNVATLADGRWHFSAWLDAQGRVKFLFHLVRLDAQRLLLLLRGGTAEAMAGQLQRYVFRTKASVVAQPALSLGTGEPLPLHSATDAPFAIGCGSHSLTVGAPGPDHWRLMQLRLGWPWLPDAVCGQLLAASLGLGELGATALDKGCYPGQEIVARLHYRGGNKRHLHRVRLSRALPAGGVLDVPGQPSIQLLDVVPFDAWAEALAVVHDDCRGGFASGIEALHEGRPVTVRGVEP